MEHMKDPIDYLIHLTIFDIVEKTVNTTIVNKKMLLKNLNKQAKKYQQILEMYIFRSCLKNIPRFNQNRKIVIYVSKAR